jgi:hypothetical protein
MSEVEYEEVILENESFVSRITQYSLVNSVYQRYNNIKDKSTYLRPVLETAENLTQPVLKKLDDTLHLDERGVAILDKIEVTASDLSNKVSDYYNQGSQFYSNQKENAGRVIIATANRPVNQILDYTEFLVDRLLPEQDYPNLDDDVNNENNESESEQSSTGEPLPPQQNPITRIKNISVNVPKRIAALASEKLIPQQMENLNYMITLLRDVAINWEDTTKVLYENAVSVHNYLDEKKDTVTELIQPAREILEKQTEDIKDKSVKALVTALTAISHVTELVKRQLLGRIPNSEYIHYHLEQVTQRTKDLILSLSDFERNVYTQKVKTIVASTLRSVLRITYAYTPDQLIPIFLQLSNLLSGQSINESPNSEYQTSS